MAKRPEIYWENGKNGFFPKFSTSDAPKWLVGGEQPSSDPLGRLRTSRPVTEMDYVWPQKSSVYRSWLLKNQGKTLVIRPYGRTSPAAVNNGFSRCAFPIAVHVFFCRSTAGRSRKILVPATWHHSSSSAMNFSVHKHGRLRGLVIKK